MGLREVQLAALLHDIGKFWQRMGISRNHADLGSDFVRRYFSEDAAKIIEQHHVDVPEIRGEKEDVLLLKIADHLSSGERERRERDEQGEPSVEGLLSIFSKINIGKGEPPEDRYYPLAPLRLDSEIIFPRTEHKFVREYKRLWKGFAEEVENSDWFFGEHEQLWKQSFETLYHLLWKYTWCIPSAVWRDVPDIALFDHLRTTCAIATCLYEVHKAETLNLEVLFGAIRDYWRIKEDKKSINSNALIEEAEFKKKNFILIGGDISGIQKFIYRIKSPQKAQKGMAKRLRGRSFYLGLLTESIAHYLLERLSLPITNLLWCGGGHFFILAPAVYRDDGRSAETEELIKQVEREVNEFLLKEFQGELFIVLGAEEGSAHDLLEFPEYLEKCKRVVGEKKKRKALSTIKALRSLNLSHLKNFTDTCSVCGRDAVKLMGEAESCEACREHEEIGRKLPWMEYLLEVLASQEPGGCDAKFEFGGLWIGWRICGRELNLDFNVDAATSTIRAYRINSTDLSMPLPREGHKGFKFYGATVPRGELLEEEGVMSFDHLAKFSQGVKRLGVLRMDVDDLGRIFSEGLNPGRIDNRTISRITTLSRMLDLFFLGYINNVAENFWAVRENVCRDCEEKLEEVSERAEMKVRLEENGRKKEFEFIRVLGNRLELLCGECRKDAAPLIYITYSGGDDLFVVAPWDVAIEFAYRLRQEFSTYVAENSNVTLSAGVFLCREKFPIGRAGQLTGEILDDGAKEVPGKNAVSVFGENVPWVCQDHVEMHCDFERLYRFGRWLESLLNKKKISRSFVYNLLSFWSETFRRIIEDRGFVPYAEAMKRKRYMPRFKYLLAKNIDRRRNEEMFLKLDDEVPKAMPYIRIPVNWALLRTRSRGGGDEA